MRVAVVGGGITGLATAALLAADGHAVELFEACDQLGGRAGSWEAEGFRFDTGPSWYLMPEVFDHFYRLLGTSADEQLDLIRLDPGYRVFFESGAAPLDLGGDRERSLQAFESVEPGSRAPWSATWTRRARPTGSPSTTSSTTTSGPRAACARPRCCGTPPGCPGC